MVLAIDRRPELGYAAAKNVALARTLLRQENNEHSWTALQLKPHVEGWG